MRPIEDIQKGLLHLAQSLQRERARRKRWDDTYKRLLQGVLRPTSIRAVKQTLAERRAAQVTRAKKIRALIKARRALAAKRRLERK